MTSAERNNLGSLPAQQKLEWVTPKILPMEAEDTEGKLEPGTELTSAPNNGPS
jgi:hypothetical protein